MRRINAMRFVRGLPAESRQAIENGQVNLSTLSLAQSRTQMATPQEKLELFETLKGKSQKQTEQLLADRAGEPIPEERERVLAGGAVQIQFVADAELAEMFERIRGLVAHVNPKMSYAELIKTMAKRTLKQLDPAQPRMTRSFSAAEKRCSTNQPTSRAIPRTIPQTTRRMVWARDRGQCTYRDPETGTLCDSRFLLQLDHIQPWALGGTHTAENLRMRCQAHNLHTAAETFARTQSVLQDRKCSS